MKDIFQLMLEELLSSRLEVCKVPSREGGYIRVTNSVNAEWYSQFCKRYVSTRRRYPRPRTIIRRKATVLALERMIRGDRTTVYALRLLDFIEGYGREEFQKRMRINFKELAERGMKDTRKVNSGEIRWLIKSLARLRKKERIRIKSIPF